MQYVHLYYLTVTIALCAVPLYLRRRLSYDIRLLSGILGALVSVVYLVGMIRSEGIDLDIYRENYEGSYQNSIPDVGFRLLMYLLKVVHLPFEALMLIMGITSILAIHRLSMSFRLSFTLLLLLWFIHLAVVRDFSQTRIGFAMALAVLAITSKSMMPRVIFYGLAISMHLTSAVFVFAYEACLYIARLDRAAIRSILIMIMIFLIFVMGNSIGALSFFDERVDIYLNWEREGYGLPVESYGPLLLHCGVVLIALICRKHWIQDSRLRAIFYLELLGITFFIAFSDVAIFAFRLSNVLVSLYFLLIARCFVSLYESHKKMSLVRFGVLAQAYFITLFLLFRPGSYDLLAAITIR